MLIVKVCKVCDQDQGVQNVQDQEVVSPISKQISGRKIPNANLGCNFRMQNSALGSEQKNQ